MSFARGSTRGAEEGDSDARRRAIRTFVAALAFTPTWVLPYATGSLGPVSAESAVRAVAIGAVAGLAVFLLVDGVDLSGVSDAVSVVAALAFIAVGTAVVWSVLSPDAIPAFAVGSLAFVWAVALGGVTRHVAWPRFAAKEE
ncbi:hypothetical protein I7X12_01935 [Halosimplex litoreum]|uniref:Uncharacterized protein n=1 Tax=Halosimplex litoreum TaxID=1198301 RepID=A0A7T3FZB0_9EURY|nr:hypothetical protein [Halosimplex litoreum]QPV63421.1 hypothetical protein I7X12_01935 [Halosimplex litoreum]